MEHSPNVLFGLSGLSEEHPQSVGAISTSLSSAASSECVLVAFYGLAESGGLWWGAVPGTGPEYFVTGTGVPSSGDPENRGFPQAGHRSSNPAITGSTQTGTVL
ncbi:hypothetical protein F2Q70_00030051 [Brassica cretica]|uniref:Uncharacterized protein n=2 Tax=Brassica cretica TaxID=69181 RepID=A0A3N6Q920_BRACR|nr:hypothetical protein F2Q70_00030051 [Brassica cretica]KAF2553146.1 hypothetical protein F2Q68_00034529 [Brassica cretica]KAF3597535.1 hypothetical protein DY000_02022359 [Brassica cretica]